MTTTALTTRQKLQAMKALGILTINIYGDDLDNFCAVISGIELGGDGLLTSVFGKGKNQFDAVNDLWQRLTQFENGKKFVVLNAYDDKNRRNVRWNGFMWEDVPREA